VRASQGDSVLDSNRLACQTVAVIRAVRNFRLVRSLILCTCCPCRSHAGDERKIKRRPHDVFPGRCATSAMNHTSLGRQRYLPWKKTLTPPTVPAVPPASTRLGTCLWLGSLRCVTQLPIWHCFAPPLTSSRVGFATRCAECSVGPRTTGLA
jgi:hypothetical protein